MQVWWGGLCGFRGTLSSSLCALSDRDEDHPTPSWLQTGIDRRTSAAGGDRVSRRTGGACCWVVQRRDDVGVSVPCMLSIYFTTQTRTTGQDHCISWTGWKWEHVLYAPAVYLVTSLAAVLRTKENAEGPRVVDDTAGPMGFRAGKAGGAKHLR